MEDIWKERICAAALGKIFGYEPLYASGLISKLGSASAVFELSPKEADEALGPYSKYKGTINREMLENTGEELERLQGKGFRYIARTEQDFPPLLLECEDCPTGLYYRSISPPGEVFRERASVAIVGTRDISPYGRDWTRKIVDACAQSPARPLIVSGLAFGVDITAHLAALDSGLSTIAVLPCGIDEIYPTAHRSAAERIASSPGSAVVTDYPPGTSPVAFTFVRRNRIIAGLAGCTVLVESKANGGGLITCRLANSYGRDVFALPGRVDDVRSAGCNAIIRDGTAEAITGLSGLGEQLGLGRYAVRERPSFPRTVEAYYRSRTEASEVQDLILLAELIAGKRGIDLEELCYQSGRSYNEVVRLAMLLESDGFIAMDLMQRCTINERKS
ncbi:MAG: DNA-processing protein DprA [Bacteroidales bacterium]|nr:DNA-processing protein DprA [Bacteroidales bacterium]